MEHLSFELWMKDRRSNRW